MQKIFIGIFIAIFGALLLYIFILKNNISHLKAEMEICNKNLYLQNIKIEHSNKKLQEYNATLENNKIIYQHKILQMQKEIKAVKNNDQAMDFLKNYLRNF